MENSIKEGQKKLKEALIKESSFLFEKEEPIDNERIDYSSRYNKYIDSISKRTRNTWWKYIDSIGKRIAIIVMAVVFVGVIVLSIKEIREPLSNYIISLFSKETGNNMIIENNNNNNFKSFFTITALAANGESTKLSPASSVFNSSNPGKTIFGNDYPTFSFSVLPSESNRYEEIYMQFEVSVSYGGKTVNTMDEHIAIGYLINPQVSDKTSGYSIGGWFTEPTDLVITLTDKESKKVVEEITLNVKYDSDRQEYELKLLGIDNEYSK